MALGFAVGSRGADHNRSGAYEADFSSDVDRLNLTLDSVPFAIDSEDRAALMDSLILCKFLRGVFADFYEDSASMLRLVTGWDVSAEELKATAGRIVAAKQQFNILAGWSAEEDSLPKRFSDADVVGTIPPARLQEAIAEYRRLRGWNPDGKLPAAMQKQLLAPSI